MANDGRGRCRCFSCCCRCCPCPCRSAAAARCRWRAQDQGQARGEVAAEWRASLNCRKLPTRLSAATSNSDSAVGCQGCWTRIRCFRSRSLNLCNHAELTLAWVDHPRRGSNDRDIVDRSSSLSAKLVPRIERDYICNCICSLLIIVGVQRNVKKVGGEIKFTLKEKYGTEDLQNCEIPGSNEGAT